MHAHHLEVLGAVPRRGIGVPLVEGVGKADALDRLLRDAIDHDRCGDARSLKERRHHVDHMVKLPANAALVGDARRPGDRHAVARAAEE